jgi:hypothetical protein
MGRPASGSSPRGGVGSCFRRILDQIGVRGGRVRERLQDRVVPRLRLQLVVEGQRPARRALPARKVLLQPGVPVRQAEVDDDLDRRLRDRDREVARVHVGDAASRVAMSAVQPVVSDVHLRDEDVEATGRDVREKRPVRGRTAAAEAEGEGFEPSIRPTTDNGFRDSPLLKQACGFAGSVAHAVAQSAPSALVVLTIDEQLDAAAWSDALGYEKQLYAERSLDRIAGELKKIRKMLDVA